MSDGVRAMRPRDWPEVAHIYAAGIATHNATFETDPPSWEDFDNSRLQDLRFVAIDETGAVVGWSAAGSVSDRCVYSRVADHGVYVHPDHQGRGLGVRLLQTLIDASEDVGFWTLQSGIFPENTASLAIHERLEFRVVGTRVRLGRHLGRWRMSYSLSAAVRGPETPPECRGHKFRLRTLLAPLGRPRLATAQSRDDRPPRTGDLRLLVW